MVLGLKHATGECHTVKGREPVYAAMQAFLVHFEARNGTVVCRDLLGCDISTPQGAQAAKERGLYKSVCPETVRTPPRSWSRCSASPGRGARRRCINETHAIRYRRKREAGI